jgi:hypothetical protein
MRWNHEREQYKNKRPHDTKYTLQRDKTQSQRHIQDDKKNTYMKTENEYYAWIAPKTCFQQWTPDDKHHLQYATDNTEFYTVTTREFLKFYNFYYFRGTRQRSWLRGYATSRKVAGSSPDEVIGFFQLT